MGPEHFEPIAQSTEMQELGQKYNAAANELVEAVGKATRSPGENEESIPEKNADFALGQLARALKSGSDIEEALKQLEQMTIVGDERIPEVDLLFSEITDIARDYHQAIRRLQES